MALRIFLNFTDGCTFMIYVYTRHWIRQNLILRLISLIFGCSVRNILVNRPFLAPSIAIVLTVVSIWLTLLSIVSLFMARFTDPGIVPPRTGSTDSHAHDEPIGEGPHDPDAVRIIKYIMLSMVAVLV
jgi:hypothetical protein